jgi:hypothetical protein
MIYGCARKGLSLYVTALTRFRSSSILYPSESLLKLTEAARDEIREVLSKKQNETEILELNHFSGDNHEL